MKKKTTKKTRAIDVHFSSKTMSFETDPNTFALLDAEFQFDLDLYASAKNKLCTTYFSEKRPAEGERWRKYGKRAYGNPEYGRTLYPRMSYAVEQAEEMDVIVLLVPARVDARWFRLLANYGVVNLLPGRQSFYLHGEPAQVWSKKQEKFIHCKAPFPSAVVVLGKKVFTPCIRLWNEGDKFLPKELRA